MKLYKYVNGHALYTKNSPELENQFLRAQIVKNCTCKNCGKTGDEVFEGEPCPLSRFQSLDKLMEKTYNKVEEAESIVRQAKLKNRKGD